ncbi:MAG: WYL domain-containing protein [Aquihabitans sp.]
MSPPRISVGTRIQRLLAILQWVDDRPDGVPVTEVCERFNMGPADLVKEIEMATMIGGDTVHYDDMPFAVFVDDGLVVASLLSFRRPLRLTPAEGFALVSSADALLGADPDSGSALARALAKLAELLDIEPGEAIDVDLDPDGGPLGRALADAVKDQRQVAFTYWSYGRDVVTARLVDPWRVFSHEGEWYLAGRDTDRDEVRHFRLDRIEAMEVRDAPSDAPPANLESLISIPGSAPQVVIDLPSDARWVVEAYPVVAAEPSPTGGLRVTMAVTGASWLERLLLRVGPEAKVIQIDPILGDRALLAGAARRVLSRYGAATAPR